MKRLALCITTTLLLCGCTTWHVKTPLLEWDTTITHTMPQNTPTASMQATNTAPAGGIIGKLLDATLGVLAQ